MPLVLGVTLFSVMVVMIVTVGFLKLEVMETGKKKLFVQLCDLFPIELGILLETVVL